MGWAQPLVTSGKRQFPETNTTDENGCSDDQLRARLNNKRSRETSPPRKPLALSSSLPLSTRMEYSSSLGDIDICSIKSDLHIDDSDKEKNSAQQEELEFICGNTNCLKGSNTESNISCVANFGSSEESVSNLDFDVTDSVFPHTIRPITTTEAVEDRNFKMPSSSSSSVLNTSICENRNSSTNQISKGKPSYSVTTCGSRVLIRGANKVSKHSSRTHSKSSSTTNTSKSSQEPSSNETEDYTTTDETEDEEESDEELSVGTSEQSSIPQSESELAEGSAAESSESSLEVNRHPAKVVPVFRPSYFSYVPPYINFCQHDEIGEKLPEELRKILKWRLSPITPVVVRKTVSNTGFRLLRKSVEWSGQWGKHMKANLFRSALKDYQKLNHLPATFQIGRKDRLWKNYNRFLTKFGKSEFGFLPRTYILPHETKVLKQAWDAAEKGRPWIVKPPANARGTGIRVINKWVQVPKKRQFIVQKYITNPLLINGRKFDLRLYVLVTNFHPMKIYLYRDGLVRFAPLKYSDDPKRVSDRFMHLTNYSINKNCDLYAHNEDAEATEGHKWTLKTLWRYLKENNYDVDTLWSKIEDIAVKTIICAEDSITANAFQIPNRYNGYELFGFDIILDDKLKPWLLEVNISPSLHSSSPLDLAIKGPLIKEVFNLVGYHLPPTMPTSLRKPFMSNLESKAKLETPIFDKRIYSSLLTKEEKSKQTAMRSNWEHRDKYLSDIVSSLTSDDVRHLITAEDELGQCDGFTRIFPTTESYKYFGFLDGPRYYNMLFDAWEHKYNADRTGAITRLQLLCDEKFHLQGVQAPITPTLDKMPSFPIEPDAENFEDELNGNNFQHPDQEQLNETDEISGSSSTEKFNNSYSKDRVVDSDNNPIFPLLNPVPVAEAIDETEVEEEETIPIDTDSSSHSNPSINIPALSVSSLPREMCTFTKA